MVPIAALTRLLNLLRPALAEVPGNLRARQKAAAPVDEFVTVATFDKATAAHIALGRLSAEGIEAQIFDENIVQMGLNTLTTFGGIKLRVNRSHEKAARQVLETDYSKTLEGADLGKRED